MARTILVSAGHSTVPPRDPGAVGNGYVEAELAVELRDMVARILKNSGVNVITDGADGKNEPLRKAIALAKTADVAVEIHWNASNGAGHGIECLAKPKYKAISKKLAGAVAAATGLKLRGESGWKADNSGQHKSLGFCNAGGVILEVCFIDNKNDMTTYQRNKSMVAHKLAEVLANSAGTNEVVDDNGGNPQPPAKPPEGGSYPNILLRRGSYNSHVGKVQKRLKDLGYTLAVDNDFGSGTERAVKAFQRKAGLDDDGVVGRWTWNALFPN